MKYLLFFTAFLYSVSLSAQKGQNTYVVSGQVVSVQGVPIAHAIVAEKGTFNEVETDSQGMFHIQLQPESELLVTSFLMNPITILPETNDSNLKIVMTTDAEVLEAVLLKKKKEEERYINTTLGKKNKNAVGYGVDDMVEKFISPGDTDMFTVFRRVPGVRVSGALILGGTPSVSFLRAASINSGPAMIMVDGVPAPQNILATLNPDIVTSITLLRGLAATVIYGQQGTAGIIKITTKNAVVTQGEEEEAPSMLVTNNTYDEVVPLLSEVATNANKEYLTMLRKAQNPDQALAMYNELKELKKYKTVPFYINVTDYFSKWGNLYTHKILSDLYTQAQNNPRVLKTIAFILEEKKMLHQALFVLEHTLERYPGHIQLYRDLAKLYVETGRYNLAATLYKQMLYNTVPEVDFTPIENIVINEFRSLIAHHKNKIDYASIPNELLVANFKKDIRIVLEYTNAQSEFEVQFISPKNKYYTWSHTYFENQTIMEQEIASGFALKEFSIEDSDYGDWMVNIQQTKTTETATPTYLKYTIYKNYGLPSETKEVKVINLSDYTQKITLDSFVY